jgi:EmrB/QacA subfamily drug resistance transporter
MHQARMTDHQTANVPNRHLGIALLVIAGAQLMIVLDATVVNVALPTIHQSLHFSTANLEWLITAYSLTFGGLLLFGGRTGDLFGKRRMFMAGIALFAVASLLGGLASSDTWLILTRGAQGVGAAIASPTALSLIATNFSEGPARNRAMGVYAAMAGAGGAVGLLLGGLFTDYISWRWIFFVNVPVAAVILVLAPRSLAESATTSGHLDLPGALSVTGGMLSLVYGLSKAATHPWGSATVVVPLVIAAVLLALFVLVEARTPSPLMPLRIFADRNRSAAYAMMLCIGTALFSMFYFLTQFLQNILGWSPVKTGVGFLPATIAIVAAAGLTSRLVGKTGVRLPLLVGPACVVIGLAWLSALTVQSGYLNVLGPLLIIAVGMGVTFVCLTLTAVSRVKPQETGLASALLNTGQQVGGALGLAVLATVAINATTSKAKSLASTGHSHRLDVLAIATTHGYTTAFEVATVVALVALIISALVIRTPRTAMVSTSHGVAGASAPSYAGTVGTELAG